MPRKLCRDRILEVLESVSEPISTREATALVGMNRHTVGQNLRALWEDQKVIRIGQGNSGPGGPQWIIQPPLVLQVYEGESAADQEAFGWMDRAIALAKREREQRL